MKHYLLKTIIIFAASICFVNVANAQTCPMYLTENCGLASYPGGEEACKGYYLNAWSPQQCEFDRRDNTCNPGRWCNNGNNDSKNPQGAPGTQSSEPKR